MKRYIRHFDKKHWYNFLLEGKVFFWQKKLGIYAMKKSPTIYLKKIENNVKMITLLKDNLNKVELLDLTDIPYYEIENNDILEITYTNGQKHTVVITYNAFLHSYYYN